MANKIQCVCMMQYAMTVSLPRNGHSLAKTLFDRKHLLWGRMPHTLHADLAGPLTEQQMDIKLMIIRYATSTGKSLVEERLPRGRLENAVTNISISRHRVRSSRA